LTFLYNELTLQNQLRRINVTRSKTLKHSDKTAISAVVSLSAKERMQRAGGGNFTKGVEICAKSFAQFARGTANFNAADAVFNDELVGKSVSDCVALWLNRGYWLPNLFCYLSQELADGNLTIDIDLKLTNPADKK
jgi:hypothetical protein